MFCVLSLLSLPRFKAWSLYAAFSLSIGSWVGLRYFLFRDEIRDQSNYRLYNIWLVDAHLLPENGRSLCWDGSIALLRQDHGLRWSLGVCIQ